MACEYRKGFVYIQNHFAGVTHIYLGEGKP